MTEALRKEVDALWQREKECADERKQIAVNAAKMTGEMEKLAQHVNTLSAQMDEHRSDTKEFRGEVNDGFVLMTQKLEAISLDSATSKGKSWGMREMVTIGVPIIGLLLTAFIAVINWIVG